MEQALTQSAHLDWLFFDGKMPVATFIPSVVDLLKAIKTDGNMEEHVRIKITFKGGESAEFSVPISDIDRIDWFDVDRRCILNPANTRAKKYISASIRAGISSAPEKTVYQLDRLGLFHINQRNVFVAGERVITRSLTHETCSDFELSPLPFRLDIDESISPSEAIEGMLELISLSFESGPVLVAHAISGIVRAAFKEAGITPCAVLVVVGQSGMLKSHYVPHMVQLYDRADGIGAVTRFNSTKRFIEDTLYEYSECTAVIDDLHTAESRSIKRTNEDTAEEIIRRVSDDTGRGRMDGKTHVQRHFRGNAVFIGEYTIGKASTVPRALVVNLTKPPNGAILDHYQRHQPLLVSTFYYFFIQWYVDHFDEITNAIDAELTELRATTAASTTHGRLRDTQFYLQISWKLFCEFCKDSGYCSEEDAKDTYSSFSTQLHELVQAQQARFRESVEAKKVDYLALIRSLYKKDEFRIAKGVNDFDPEIHDGLLYYDDCLCIRRKCLERHIKKIYPRCDIDECVSTLISKDALKLVKKKNTVQINALDGKRFYAIRLDKLR